KHKAKNLSYFAKIQQAFTEKAKADTAFVGLIGKNPLNDSWHVFQPNYEYAYSLDELADWVVLPKKILKRKATGEGRNCWLFETVRKWSYREVLFYKANQATESDFRNVVLARLEKLNIFPNAQPLNFNELKAIAKSISKWTWERFSAEKFSEIQSHRNKQREQIKKMNIAREAFNEFS
ncbi:replication initiation protein, partial [Rodentibacter caecimuris]|uniref:replication initiation protein n=1 Tax=Rodentibacter caecimuris TaxID=1796644 RepID=UPI00178CC566